MYAKIIILASAFACVAATRKKSAWQNVAEPQCNNCKCYYGAPQMDIKPLRSLFAQKRYILMASKVFHNCALGTVKEEWSQRIKTLSLSPHLLTKAIPAGMWKRFVETGRIQGNVIRYQLETRTGTSRKIRYIEGSVMGDGLFSFGQMRQTFFSLTASGAKATAAGPFSQRAAPWAGMQSKLYSSRYPRSVSAPKGPLFCRTEN